MLVPLVALLLRGGTDPTEALYDAIAADDAAAVRRAVRAGADLRRSSNTYDRPPLFYALPSPPMFDLVRRLGASLNGTDVYGRTLLHYLVSDFSTLVTNRPTKPGEPVFFNFIGSSDTAGPWDRREKVAADLLRHGVSLLDRDFQGRTALHYAVQSGWRGVDLVLRLLELQNPNTYSRPGGEREARIKAVLDARDHEGQTPLMRLACCPGSVQNDAIVAGRLIVAGASLEARDPSGHTAEDLARAAKSELLAAMLKAKRENVEP